MKLFIFDLINRYKRLSESLDAKTMLCNRSWVVFNDGGEREVYKFKEDGSINIILSGRVTLGSWEYDPNDKSLIISAANQSYLVHPRLFEKRLLALNVDGTSECAFMIDTEQENSFEPKTYSALVEWFETKEKARIAQEEAVKNEEESRRIEDANRKKAIEEQNKIAEEKKKNQERLCKNFQFFLKKNGISKLQGRYNKISGFFLSIILIISCYITGFLLYNNRVIGMVGKCVIFIIFSFILHILMYQTVYRLTMFCFVTPFFHKKIESLAIEFVIQKKLNKEDRFLIHEYSEEVFKENFKL